MVLRYARVSTSEQNLDAQLDALGRARARRNQEAHAGRLVFHVFASIAQFERERISERTRKKLEAARKRGRVGGRPPVLSPTQIHRSRIAPALIGGRETRGRSACST